MSIVRIIDVWLANSKVCSEVRAYLINNPAVRDASLSFSLAHHENDIELKIHLNDDNRYSDQVEDDIHEILIQARLDFAQCHVLHSLAWGFSSPATTSKFKELLACKA